MRDIIQEIVATATEAGERVQAARAEVEKISSAARKRGQAVVDAARQTHAVVQVLEGITGLSNQTLRRPSRIYFR